MRALVVLTTTPDVRSARKLARHLVEKKLAACVSFREGFESVYRWKGKLERSSEVLLLVKTSQVCLARLQKAISKNHPYEIPEFLAIPVSRGSGSYLGWLEDSLK